MNVLQNGSGNGLGTNVPVNAEMNGNGIEMVIRRQGGGACSPSEPGSNASSPLASAIRNEWISSKGRGA